MASPIGHSLVGIAIATLFYPKALNWLGDKTLWLFMLVAVFLANSPDLDFVPGFLVNDPGRYHHMASHSVLVVLAIAPIIALFLGKLNSWPLSPAKTLAFTSFVMLSHLLADYVAADGSLPYGMQALWPLDDGWYISPKTLLGPVIKGQAGSDIAGFFNAMLTPVNVRTIGSELLFGGGLLALASYYKRLKVI